MTTEYRVVRFYAAAREATGVAHISIDTNDAKSPAHLRNVLIDIYGDRIRKILDVSSVLVDGEIVSLGREPEKPFPGEGPIDIMPPFAGG